MNSAHGNGKSTNHCGNQYKDSACFIWCGSPNVTLEPLNSRNLSQNIYYSINKRNRWNIEQELMNCVGSIPDRLKIPLDSTEDWWATEPAGCQNVGRVAHKRHHNVIEVERTEVNCKQKDREEEEEEAEVIRELTQPRKWHPKKRRHHRNHHRPNVQSPTKGVDAAVQTGRDTAFVVFPRPHSGKSYAHRSKVNVIGRAHRGRKQGKRVKHACHSSQFIRELRNDDSDCETELHTDEEYEQDLRAFLRSVEREPLSENLKNDSIWFGGEFPMFDETYFDREEEEAKEYEPVVKWDWTEPTTTLVPRINTPPIEHQDLISQFEYLLCHNKTTLEYLQSAVEKVQTYALWKYLEFITAPFDNDIPCYPDDVPRLTTYSTPPALTCTSWSNPTMPWTMITSDAQSTTWSDHTVDLLHPCRANIVFELNSQWTPGRFESNDAIMLPKLTHTNFMSGEMMNANSNAATSIRMPLELSTLPMLPICQEQISRDNFEHKAENTSRENIITDDELAMLHILLPEDDDDNENDSEALDLNTQFQTEEREADQDTDDGFEVEDRELLQLADPTEDNVEDDWVIVDFDSGNL